MISNRRSEGGVAKPAAGNGMEGVFAWSTPRGVKPQTHLTAPQGKIKKLGWVSICSLAEKGSLSNRTQRRVQLQSLSACRCLTGEAACEFWGNRTAG